MGQRRRAHSAGIAPPNAALVEDMVRRALLEDLSWGDLTTDNLIDPSLAASAHLVAKQEGVVAGISVAALAFRLAANELHLEVKTFDGTRVVPGTVLAAVEGPVAGMLRAERVALNFLQRMSGIATSTFHYVEAVAGTGVRIVDTRKTTPNLRLLEKYAVRVGGGRNHRFGLSDGVLIKDNHIAALRAAGQTIRDAVALARERVPHTMRIEVEAESIADVAESLAAGADAILLDNMSIDDLRAAVLLIDHRALAEASGGISLRSIRAVAETGVDLISVGALTHSSPALDISLDLII